MKSLTLYLIKDISDIILDYLYRPDKRLLNMEYYDEYHVNRHYIYNKCGFVYNFRLGSDGVGGNYILNVKLYANFEIYGKDIPLPKNYRYSSGCNNLNKYKENEN